MFKNKNEMKLNVRTVIAMLLFATTGTVFAAPRDALPLDAPEWTLNYRLHLDGAAKVKLSDDLTITLDAKVQYYIAVEQPADGVLRMWNIKNCEHLIFDFYYNFKKK